MKKSVEVAFRTLRAPSSPFDNHNCYAQILYASIYCRRLSIKSWERAISLVTDSFFFFVALSGRVIRREVITLKSVSDWRLRSD